MLTNLFSPIRINNIEIKNRIVLPAILLGLANPDGSVSDEIMDFYVRRAMGGVGLIIVGTAYIHISSRMHSRALAIDDDSLIDGYKKLTDEVKRYGARIMLQLTHYGRMAPSHLTGSTPIAPSPIPSKLTGEIPREMTVDEIKHTESLFADAAYRAYKSGFDGVEIHAAVGNLISTFLSPATNMRNDEYGGDIENRTRFLTEIIDEIKRRVPKNFLVGCRLSVEDYLKNGLTINQSKHIARILEEHNIDFIDVITGWHESPKPLISREVPQGGVIHLAAEIKKVISIPVIGGTRIKDPRLADKLIGEGLVDMVFIARQLIADPDYPIKAKNGNFSEIRPCIGCLECLSRIFEDKPVKCSVNPRLGSELFPITKVSKPKKVLVIGGGPAGLEAALILTQRGHNVILVESRDKLGGTINIIRKIPYKEEIYDLVKYYETVLTKLGVKVLRGREADVNLVKSINPDVVIVAVGARMHIPDIPGINLPHVKDAITVLSEEYKVDGNVVVVGGGGVGLDVADYLSEIGADVTIIEMLEKVGQDIPRAARWVQIKRLKEKGVKILTKARVITINKEDITVIMDSKSLKLKASHVVLATGMRSNIELAEKLREYGYRVFTIGDCNTPARILEAIKSAYETSLAIK